MSAPQPSRIEAFDERGLAQINEAFANLYALGPARMDTSEGNKRAIVGNVGSVNAPRYGFQVKDADSSLMTRITSGTVDVVGTSDPLGTVPQPTGVRFFNTEANLDADTPYASLYAQNLIGIARLILETTWMGFYSRPNISESQFTFYLLDHPALFAFMAMHYDEGSGDLTIECADSTWFRMPRRSSDPSGGLGGEVIYRTDTGKFRGFNGDSGLWENLN
jgi:hypothetical protein